MSHFEYRGRNSQGQLVLGKLEASSVELAANQLTTLGVIPVELKQVGGDESGVQSWFDRLNERKLTTVDLIMFCRQMYTITKSGIPLIRGVRGLSVSINHALIQRALSDVATRLESGSGLSAALQQHPKIFNNLFISIIHVGENSGRLDEAFLQLSEYMERDLETSRSIKTALRYPTFVIIALSLAMVVVNIKVIPAFANMFEKFGADLPLATRVLIGISDFFVAYWPYMLVAVVTAYFSWHEYLKTDNGQRFWGAKKLKLPVIGDIIERGSMARYSRSFSLMLRSGVPLITALGLCSRVIDNLYLGEKISEIRSGIERGESLLRTHTSSGMFTSLVLQMISVGEESGQVDELLSEVAAYYEREVDYDVASLNSKIEPILIVIMAGFVLILALGIFLPMWDMYNVQK